MPLMTAAQIQEHFNTDAADDAIERLIDAEEAAIIRILGEVATQTDVYRYSPGVLVLTRRATAITSITEDDVVLDADDYHIDLPGRVLYRKGWGLGTNYIIWGDEVSVTYVPYDDTVQRIRALTFLVGLGLVQNGYRVQRNTEMLQEPLDYQKERARTLRSLTRYPRFA